MCEKEKEAFRSITKKARQKSRCVMGAGGGMAGNDGEIKIQLQQKAVALFSQHRSVPAFDFQP